MKRPNLRPRALLVGFLAASMLVAGACSTGGTAQSGATNGLEVLSWWTSASEKPVFSPFSVSVYVPPESSKRKFLTVVLLLLISNRKPEGPIA